MNEFDDPELGRSLGRLSGAYPDEVVAFSQVQGKVRQARRRRAAGLAGSATLVAAFSVGAFALSGQRSAQRLVPADRSEVSDDGDAAEFTTTLTPTTVVVTSSTELTTTTESTVPEPTTSDDAAGGDDQGPTNTEGQGPVVSVGHSGSGSSTATTVKSAPKAPKPTVPPTQPPQTTPPATAAPTTSAPDGDDDHGGSFTPSTQSFSGIGGSITVSIDSDGHLRMLSYTANPGYTADDIRNGSSRVSIRFRNGGLSTRIRVDVVGDGMQPFVEEEG